METEWKFKWANPEKFESERKKSSEAHDSFRNKWINRNDYFENAKVLREALDEYEKLVRNFSGGGTEGYYYSLKEQTNLNDTKIRKKINLIDNFQKEQSMKTLFFHLNLAKISEDKQKKFLKSQELSKYHNFLKEIFENSKYLLSEEGEKILSLKSLGSYDLWIKMLEGFLAKETRKVVASDGKEKEMTYDELLNLTKNKDKKLRDNAGKAFNDIMKKYYEIAEFELNAVLENAKVDGELRNFKRVDESRIRGDLIDFDFIDSLLLAVKERYDLSKRYYSLLSKLTGQKKFNYYERGIQLFEINKKYSFEEATKIVKKIFSKMHPNFLKIFQNMLEKGQVDVFARPGKKGGAFCTHFRIDDLIYVLLNFSGNIQDIVTLAHEMGHAINGHYMQKNENALNYEYSKATAEVASIFMEDFVFEEIKKEFQDEEKFYLLLNKILNEISGIQRQIALYFFELELHKTYRKEGYLSKEKISEIFSKHMSEYLGDLFDKETMKYGWIYWEHIRLYFYVYSYASGSLISKAMQKKYKEDPSFIKKIEKFLSTGTSKTPREIFNEMGIEINKEFFLTGLEKVEEELDEVEELGKKLGKI